jgi:hypothetical protein
MGLPDVIMQKSHRASTSPDLPPPTSDSITVGSSLGPGSSPETSQRPGLAFLEPHCSVSGHVLFQSWTLGEPLQCTA